MPTPPPQEHVAPGQCFIVGYDGSETGHPLVARKMVPWELGYVVPANYAVCTDPRFATHVFVGVTPIADDRRVLWNFMRLPGPWIPDRDYDPDLGPVQVRRRSVAFTTQTATLTATTSLTYKTREESSIVAWEIERTWSDGTGGAGNPAYPITLTDFYDLQRGAIHQVSQLSTDLASAGSLSVSGGVATQLRFEPYNQFLRRKIIETWAIPGPTLLSEEVDDDGATIEVGRTIDLASSITEGETVLGGVWRLTESQPYSGQTTGPLRVKVTRTRALATGTSPIIGDSHWSDDLRVRIYDYWQYVPATAALPVIGDTYGTGAIMVHNIIASLTVAGRGTGYISIPTLEIATPEGGGTQATATVTDLAAVGATIADAGNATVGTIYIVSGGTFTTQALVEVSIGSLLTIDALSESGTGYATGDVVALNGGVYSSPASLLINTTKLVSIASLAAGSGYAIGDTLTLVNAAATFSTASVLTVATERLVSIAINAGGTGYAIGDTVTLTITGGTASIKAVITVATLSGSAIATFTVTTAGSYSVLGTAATQFSTSGGGSGATFQTALWGVLTFTISTQGSYTVGNNGATTPYTHTGGTGTGATFNTAVFGINTFTVTEGGSYSAPTPSTFTQLSTSGTGLGAIFGSPTWIATGLTVTSGGGYTVLPSSPVSFTSGTMTAVLDFGIGAVLLTNAGTTYYTAYPTVTPSYGNALIVANPDTLAPIAVLPDAYVIDSDRKNTDHALIKRMVWKACARPPKRKTWTEVGWSRPGTFTPLVSEFAGTVPWPGIHYRLIQPKRGMWPALEVISYKIGPFNDLPAVFVMDTPASVSRIFPVPQNCQHGTFGWRNYTKDGLGNETTIYAEKFPRSTNWRSGQIVVVGSTQRPILSGVFHEKHVTIVKDTGPLY